MNVTNNIRISKDVLAQELAGETVLLDLSGESYFGLDSVGTRVWQMLQEGRSEPELIETLLVEYEVGRQELENDVGELLEQLEKAGLIERG